MSDLGFKCADTDLGRKLHLESAIWLPKTIQDRERRRNGLERESRERRERFKFEAEGKSE